MKLILTFTAVLALFCEKSTQYSEWNFAVGRNCTQVYTTTQPKYVPYEESYYTNNWLGFKKRKTRVNYRKENHEISHIRKTCCSGYKNYGVDMCLPICTKSCGSNSVCSQPDLCKCNAGYTMDYAVDRCIPYCKNECINGECARPDECACNSGYSMMPDGLTCKAICNGCWNLEYCVDPHVCKCIDGYTRYPLERVDSASHTECKAVCVKDCVNADCVEPNVCKCHEGYVDYDDDAFTCEPRCSQGCSAFGVCTAPEVCTCLPGHELKENTRNVCVPVCDPKCVNGECIQPGVCSCYDGFVPLESDNPFTCKPYCQSPCTHGRCTAPGVCACDPGYSEANNSTSCEPICAQECHMGNCTAPNTCTCFEGYSLSKIDSHVCEPVCTRDCHMGNCTAPDTCSCLEGYQPSKAYWYECEPVCASDCHMGICSAPDTCACFNAYRLSKASPFECEPICDSECVNGRCTAPNECTCNDGYEKKNSSDDAAGRCIVVCECENGYCNEMSSACEACAEGYDLRAAIEGNATSCEPRCEGDCSQRGQCVEPQKCECNEYYLADNDTLGNPVCVHACGGECLHGGCVVESNACSCLHGWAGKRCDEPTLCGIVVFNNATAINSQFNESAINDQLESSPEQEEEPWAGPSCDPRCLREITNATKCTYRFSEEQTNVTCFIGIDSQCNLHTVVQSDTLRTEVSYVTILTSLVVVLLLIVATAIASRLYTRKRQRSKSIELMRSEQHRAERRDEDCLIENEHDGISL